ncbi:hypothetical protein TPELB_23770 [Terrisporobacter petrolearius]|uniref:Uncharacterized protein n=1 Tax=Terrisporobacter petrolearius TaxID=1460447 RepID=A0ABZ3FF75_9FIRM
MIIKKYPMPKEPNIGEKCVQKRFAILPKKIQENNVITIIFFQSYYKFYEYCEMWIRPEGKVRYKGKDWKLIKESVIK